MALTLRYSVSAFVGIIITATLFIGMLGLLKQSKATPSSGDVNIDFSFLRDFNEPVETPDPPKEIPEPKEVIQPPAAPTLTVKVDNNPAINLPKDGISRNKPNLLAGIKLPGLGNGWSDVNDNQSGAIKAAIAPLYPPTELMKKTEGWVRLQITINEFGGVSAVSVVDAQPKRVFDAAAKKAIKKWKFHPKVVDGQAVSFVVTQTIEFKIDQ